MASDSNSRQRRELAAHPKTLVAFLDCSDERLLADGLDVVVRVAPVETVFFWLAVFARLSVIARSRNVITGVVVFSRSGEYRRVLSKQRTEFSRGCVEAPLAPKEPSPSLPPPLKLPRNRWFPLDSWIGLKLGASWSSPLPIFSGEVPRHDAPQFVVVVRGGHATLSPQAGRES